MNGDAPVGKSYSNCIRPAGGKPHPPDTPAAPLRSLSCVRLSKPQACRLPGVSFCDNALIL
jgi:hypothetical protein